MLLLEREIYCIYTEQLSNVIATINKLFILYNNTNNSLFVYIPHLQI